MNVSVIIPVYNAAPFLRNAVESAMVHTEVKEIILVEDGSSDDSLDVAQQLAKDFPIVKVYSHPNGENRGAGASRNLGMDKATQEFIAFLDADDVFTDLRFSAEKELFKNPEIEGVFGAIGVNFLSEKGKENYENKFKNSKLTTVNYPAQGKEVFRGLLLEEQNFGVFFSLIALTVRKSAIDRENLRFNENLRVHQDTDFIRKLSYHTQLSTGIIDRAVALRGVHDDNRITQISPYSSRFYSNLLKLYTSTYQWSQTVALEKEITDHIKLRYQSFKIANESGVKKYLDLGIQALKNPKILKTRYRFHALKKHQNDEKN